jgi:dihydrofolate reductase
VSATRVVLVAALARNRVIGREGTLPWRLPDDLRRFRALTEGGVVLMGRKTRESIGRALPRRRNLVLSRNPAYRAEGCETVTSLEAALALAGPETPLWVIGGGDVYRLALPRADRLELTWVEAEVPGDATFPAFDPSGWRETARVAHPADETHPLPFTFVTLDRQEPPC